MDMKSKIIKLLSVALCLFGVMLFATTAAGVHVPFVHNIKVSFKNSVNGVVEAIGLPIPESTQAYLNDTAVPTPKPTMIPADEAYATGMTKPYITMNDEGTGLTVKGTVPPIKTPKNEMSPIAFDSAENARFADYKGDIVCVTETSYRGYDKKGKKLWDIPIQMQDPQVSVRGSYVLINETGAKKLKLYKGKKKVFDATSYGNIVSADLSKKGDIVVVTEKEYYKGQVLVFNKHGEVIFAWSSGSYNILDAAISPKRKVAISFLNTDTGADSFITCYDVNGEQKYKTGTYKNTVIFDVQFDGEDLNAIADNRCIGYNKKGKKEWEHSFGDKTLKNYDIAENGSKVFLLENGGIGEIIAISAGGKKYNTIKPQSMPDVVSIKSNRIAYNNGRDLVSSKFNGRSRRRAICSSDIKQMYILDGNEILCVYSSSIQVKKTVR